MPASDPITAGENVLSGIEDIIKKVIPDKGAAQAAVDSMRQMQLAGQLQEEMAALQAVTVNQSAIDQVQASSGSLFVAGARPAAMWICVVGFGVEVLVNPMFTWVAALAGHPVQFPHIDIQTLLLLLGQMLGLGYMRSQDKRAGVATMNLNG